jgi:hypothetical protein
LDNVTGIVTAPNGITDAAFSEGLGDIVATYLIAASKIGVGFFLNDATSFVRDVQNTRKNPPANAQEAEVHSAGLIIGGAFWDFRTSLMAMLGPQDGADKAAKMFFNHVTMTDRFLDSYQSLLRLDDNDANPATPSPLYCTINKAFGLHALTAVVLEGDSCVDADQGLKLKIEQDNGAGQVNVLASAWSASKIVSCPGKVKACAPATPGYLEFANDPKVASQVAPNGKRLYQAKALVSVKAAEPMTFVSYDAAGKVIGARTIQFKSRDQAADLSKRAL